MANEPREMTARERDIAVEQTAKDLLLSLSDAEEHANRLANLLDIDDVHYMAENLDSMYTSIDNLIYGGP